MGIQRAQVMDELTEHLHSLLGKIKSMSGAPTKASSPSLIVSISKQPGVTARLGLNGALMPSPLQEHPNCSSAPKKRSWWLLETDKSARSGWKASKLET